MTHPKPGNLKAVSDLMYHSWIYGVHSGISGGAAFLREDEMLDDLVERADTVLFLSLEAGGDRVTFDT